MCVFYLRMGRGSEIRSQVVSPQEMCVEMPHTRCEPMSCQHVIWMPGTYGLMRFEKWAQMYIRWIRLSLSIETVIRLMDISQNWRATLGFMTKYGFISCGNTSSYSCPPSSSPVLSLSIFFILNQKFYWKESFKNYFAKANICRIFSLSLSVSLSLCLSLSLSLSLCLCLSLSLSLSLWRAFCCKSESLVFINWWFLYNASF